MKRIIALLAGISLCIAAFAQSYPASYLGPLKGRVGNKMPYQGMDIYKNYLVSCQNQGVATVYKFDGGRLGEVLGQFNLGSFNPDNHANVANFGTEKFDRNDPLPLLYVSQAQKKTIDGLKDVLYVERIAPDFQSATTVQTIVLDDFTHLFGYALQWAIDKENGFLYGFGNTVSNIDPKNEHRVIKFRMPKLSDSDERGFVVLSAKDALECYTIEEVSDFRGSFIGQGLSIRKNKLYMPTGVGKPDRPSILYVWDLKKRVMQSYDYSQTTFSEFEDCGWYKNQLIVQAIDGLFRIKL